MTSPEEISLVEISELDISKRLAAAFLVMESLPPYYSVEGIDKTEMATAVAAMLCEQGSEVEKGFAAVTGDDVAGVLNFIHSESLPSARLISTQKLLKGLSKESGKRFREHLKHYNSDYEAAPENSFYLSRFAIHKSYRGSGLAGKMMERFLLLNKEQGVTPRRFTLHVDQHNHRAIAFYSKYGFTPVNRKKRFVTMLRS